MFTEFFPRDNVAGVFEEDGQHLEGLPSSAELTELWATPQQPCSRLQNSTEWRRPVDAEAQALRKTDE